MKWTSMKGTTMVKVIQTSIHLTYDVARIELEIPMKLRCDDWDSFELIKNNFIREWLKQQQQQHPKQQYQQRQLKLTKMQEQEER